MNRWSQIRLRAKCVLEINVRNRGCTGHDNVIVCIVRDCVSRYRLIDRTYEPADSPTSVTERKSARPAHTKTTCRRGRHAGIARSLCTLLSAKLVTRSSYFGVHIGRVICQVARRSGQSEGDNDRVVTRVALRLPYEECTPM